MALTTEVTFYNPMNLIDNGDGTYTDADTGDLTDSFGTPINAVPNQSPLDYSNTTAVDSNGLVDTAAGPNNTSGAGGSSVLTGIDSLINGIESAFTNLYQPLVSAGVISTPATTAANQAATNAAIVQQQQQAASATTNRYLVLAVAAAILILAWKQSK